MSCVNICITGPDGSGKSTLIRSLKKDLPNSMVISIWDILYSKTFEALLPFKYPLEVDNYLSKLHHKSRSLFLMHCLSEVLEIALDKEPFYIITDGYWYKYYATEIGHGSPREYLDKIVSVFKTPDYIFYLDADERLTSERKNIYSSYECGFNNIADVHSFKDFQYKCIKIIKELMQSVNSIFLNPEIPIGLLVEKIHEIINERKTH